MYVRGLERRGRAEASSYVSVSFLIFHPIREAFDIQSDDHDRYITTIEQKILSLTSNFEAVVEVNGKVT